MRRRTGPFGDPGLPCHTRLVAAHPTLATRFDGAALNRAALDRSRFRRATPHGLALVRVLCPHAVLNAVDDLGALRGSALATADDAAPLVHHEILLAKTAGRLKGTAIHDLTARANTRLDFATFHLLECLTVFEKKCPIFKSRPSQT